MNVKVHILKNGLIGDFYAEMIYFDAMEPAGFYDFFHGRNASLIV
jgi:hypothetical protein